MGKKSAGQPSDTKDRCLIRLTLNITGALRQSPMAAAAFLEGVSELDRLLPTASILSRKEFHEKTVDEALWPVAKNPQEIKDKIAALEESHPLGCLFHMDILDENGEALSRAALGLPARACLICGQDAATCAKNQAHSDELILWKTASLLDNFFCSRAADRAAAAAVRALLYEVSSTPKPGLVDRANSGSHKDMDFFTFLDSSASLIPWFHEFFCIGWAHSDEPASQLFSRLRFAGMQAEAAMFSATKGVNTHKGLIFASAILCGALGKVHAGRQAPLDSQKVLEACRELGSCSLSDFEKASQPSAAATAGETCYSAYGVFGARGEAALGFPSAVRLGVPALKHWLAAGFSLNDASVMALLAIISAVDDTNMIHRGGREMATDCKAEAGRLLTEITPANFKEKLTALDTSYIRENLSPGGCADLLAVSLMFYFLEEDGLLAPA